MTHWEGIEDASPSASRVWLARKNEKDEWKPLRKCDCKTLNAAAGDRPVYIEGGRATADPVKGIIFYNFFRGYQRELTSAVWFFKEEKSSKEVVLHPISDQADSSRIEAIYQTAIAATSSLGEGIASVLSEEAVLTDESKVKIVKAGDTLSMKKTPKGWFSSPLHLQRGYGEYTVEGEEEELSLGPVRSVVFVIHGIGEAMFSRDDISMPSMIEQMNTSRVAIQKKQVEEWKSRCGKATKAGLPKPPPPNRIEFLPIEWFNRLHDSSTELMKSLKAVTLPSIPALRTIANDIIFDVLLYLTPAFCEAVLECVTQQVNDLYLAFQKVHPDFLPSGGKCSLIGHSLGSVIVWDLLSILKDAQDGGSKFSGISIDSEESVGYHAYAKAEHADKAVNGTWGPSLTKKMEQTIPFTPATTIFLGSPLGMFLTLRGAHAVFDAMRVASPKNPTLQEGAIVQPIATPKASPFRLPTGSLYNIFNPSDPVAYRIEPLLLSPDTELPDIPTPMYLTAPGKDVRLHLKAKQIGDEIRKTFSDQKASWNSLLGSVTAFSFDGDSLKTSAVSQPDTKTDPIRFPLGGKSDRVDFSLQPAVIDNEYISAVMAHSTATYFSNLDLQEFFINRMKADETH